MNEVAAAILGKNNHMVLSTIDTDGAPSSVPVHFAYDNNAVYWASNAAAVHSQNIERDSRVSIVIFDSYQTGSDPGQKGAVYLAAHAKELHGDEKIAARAEYFARYPERNIEKFNEWSMYAAFIGQVDTEKSRDQMIYYKRGDTL